MKDSLAQDAEYKDGKKTILVGAWVNLGLIACKFFAGVWGNSQALIADAVHSVSDLATDCAVFVGIKLGKAPPDKTHQFGHGRLETLMSSLVGVALIVVAVYMAIEAGLDVYHKRPSHPNWLAITVAGLSLLSKEVLFQYTMVVANRINSPAIKANAWHHRSDALSSLAVMIGVGAAWYNPKWAIMDAYAAMVVSVFVAFAGIKILWEAVKEFVDVAPDVSTQEKIMACAEKVEGVHHAHDLRVRATGGRLQMEIHVVVDGNMTVKQGHDIAKKVETCLLDDIPRAQRVIVHVDPDSDFDESLAMTRN